MNNFNGNGYEYNNGSTGSYTVPYSGEGLAAFSRRVYTWMASGLAVTFLIGFGIMQYLTYSFNESRALLIDQYMMVYLVVALVEVLLVFVLGFAVYKLPPAVSAVLFYAYSVCNGITIAPALFVYELDSVFYVFAATAVFFAAISVYGFMTKKNLARLGPVLIIGLIILLIYSVVAMLFRIPLSDLTIGIFGIILFVGFTAFDTQKIKKGYEYFGNDPELQRRASINIALQLYLDFINLFLYILRLFGNRK